MFLPSTMGVSFLADVSGGLCIRADWGTYRKEKVAGYPQYRRDGKVPELWFRQPGTALMEVSKNDLEDGPRVRRLRKVVSSPEDAGQLVIDIVSRSWSAGLRLVTLTILNTSTSTHPIKWDCFFLCVF